MRKILGEELGDTRSSSGDSGSRISSRYAMRFLIGLRAFPTQIDPNSLKQAPKPPGSIIEVIPYNLKCFWSPWSLEVEQGSYKRPSTTGTSSSVAIPTESCHLRSTDFRV
ncbi:hypothetical protein E3N88_39982 [Mikania micrantha]|uniref:Uncharacterized protein n=1 Tax=Mikania micrantha TaxID=192012 RepID=A0A5N6LLB5_9ASTR|nr:hypothetical protein E3N88_39982 [Mikania micrantha]